MHNIVHVIHFTDVLAFEWKHIIIILHCWTRKTVHICPQHADATYTYTDININAFILIEYPLHILRSSCKVN